MYQKSTKKVRNYIKNYIKKKIYEVVSGESPQNKLVANVLENLSNCVK